jgi:hypothetical protein
MFGKLNSISLKSEINKEISGEGESRDSLPSSQEKTDSCASFYPGRRCNSGQRVRTFKFWIYYNTRMKDYCFTEIFSTS